MKGGKWMIKTNASIIIQGSSKRFKIEAKI